MKNIFDLILVQPLGFVLRICYQVFGSYGLAIIAFTIIVRLLLIPLGVKQQKSTLRQIKIKPKEDLIRKRYANDKNLLNQKIMELYQKEGHNPAAGCLPLVIQMPIIYVLYIIITRPLSYILQLPSDTINKLSQALNITKAASRYNEVSIAQAMLNKKDLVANILPAGTKIINLNFLGFNLGDSPNFHSPYTLIIPILAGLTAYLSGVVSQASSKYVSAGAQANSTMKMMNITMPLVSLWFTYQVPIGVGIYWSISSLMAAFQTLLLNKLYSPAKAAADAQAELQRAVEARKRRKAEQAAKKSAEIEARTLAEKNDRRKKAGLPPLQSLNDSNESTGEVDEQDSAEQEEENE
ncbi:MAG: YidC/Oxa1 family membrane protein insertase [Bacillota bacterium]|nr:YidC/Oxa1 family membrane protein insertase [Bacillota bacterium]